MSHTKKIHVLTVVVRFDNRITADQAVEEFRVCTKKQIFWPGRYCDATQMRITAVKRARGEQS